MTDHDPAAEPPRIVDEVTLRQLDADFRQAMTSAGIRDSELATLAERARQAHERAAAMAFAREWMAARAGQPLDQVLAEAEAELTRLAEVVPEAEAELERAREEYRDHVGYRRILERRLAEKRAEAEANEAAGEDEGRA